MVGWSFLFFVAPSLAVFAFASKFNTDVSKWDTGAVTNMGGSKCTLFLSLSVATPSAVVLFLYTTTRDSSDHNSHTFCSFYFCVFKRYSLSWFVVGWFFLFFVALSSLAVFREASAFNQDVSKWNTGAVTTMYHSKCTRFSSLWPRLPLMCILNIRQLEFHRITILTRFVIFVFVCFETVFFFVVCGGLVFFWLLHPLLQCFIKHLCSIRMCPNGIPVR